jgi:succinate dehydrogenase / fumarate reductase, cytochrome b subunit
VVVDIRSSQRSLALRSTVVLKAVTAITGLIMVLYLLAHMYGNFKVFSGQQAFDEYSAHLRTMGEPLLPREGALWLIRVVLLASVLLHIYAVVALWRRAHGAASGGSTRYESTQHRRGAQRSYASFTMRWGGIVIGLFIVYHLLHLTFHVIQPDGPYDSPYERVVNGFSVWWLTLSYTIALLAVGFHLRHGFWSAFATLGATTSPARRRNLNRAATVVAVVITAGFLIPPYAILFGGVGS